MFSGDVIECLSEMEFQEVPLVVNCVKRRRSRSQGNQTFSADEIWQRAFKRFAEFIDSEVAQLEKYFLPFPEWLNLSEKVFLFTRNDNEPQDFNERLDLRKENFDGLLELEHYHTPLSDSDKSLLRAQYTTLCILGFELVEPILQTGKPKALKHIKIVMFGIRFVQPKSITVDCRR